MRIVVCVKHVPDGRLRLGGDGGHLVRSGPGDMNPADKHALEEALRSTDGGDAEVVVVSMGPEQASETLRSALAMGADRGVLVSDPAAVGSDLLVTSKVLAKVIEREHADLVLFGQQASDGVGGVLWQAVAGQLGLPFVSQATTLRLDGAQASVGRQTEFGDDVVVVALPAVVSVTDAINEPRYASLKGKMAAKKKPLDVVVLADLGMSAAEVGSSGSRTVVLAVTDPPVRAGSTKVVDDGGAARAVFDFLVERQLA